MPERLIYPTLRFITYALLAFVMLLALFPFLYMISLSLQTEADTFAGYPVIIPQEPQFRNYIDIWDRAPFARFILNSFIVAGSITLSHLVFDPMVGYVFAKLHFPGRDVIFVIILSTLMLPFFVRMIPMYMMMARFQWLNTYRSLIVPFVMSAYGIFMMRQFILPIPSELMDAGRIDGCSEVGIFWRIVLPQCKPALATLGLLTFIFQWNEFIWPLIVVKTTDMRPVTIGLTLFNQEYFTQWNYTATGAVLIFIPSLLLFLFAQKFLVRGVVLSGLK